MKSAHVLLQVNVYYYAQQNQWLRAETSKSCRKCASVPRHSVFSMRLAFLVGLAQRVQACLLDPLRQLCLPGCGVCCCLALTLWVRPRRYEAPLGGGVVWIFEPERDRRIARGILWERDLEMPEV